ncbi:common central domain of tyrosinase-domain-containing protein, partial [Melanogaster broomeanus]
TNMYPLVGRSGTGGSFDRLSIEELQANKQYRYQWSLFILALAGLQRKPIDFPGVVYPPLNPAASFMEIGGIHGKPFREYVGDREDPSSDNFVPIDYKAMPPVSFITWHRAYVMLIEVPIGEYAENIAEQIEISYPDEAGLWVPAAKQLRFPFPPGEAVLLVTNPLARYEFPYLPDDFRDITRVSIHSFPLAMLMTLTTDCRTVSTGLFSQWEYTVRCAPMVPGPPRSDYDVLNALAIFRLIGQSARFFMFPDDGDSSLMQFSNTLNQSRPEMDYAHIGSLELAHNLIHTIAGGNGHLLVFEGFDPIFFLHHANVDRFAALWEWCYPQYWMNDGYPQSGQTKPWLQSSGPSASSTPPIPGNHSILLPFRHPDGTYWTNTETRFLTTHPSTKVYPKYGKFHGISVDKAATSPKEQRIARAKIAKYYGVDFKKSKQQNQASSWAYLPVPNVNEAVGLPENHTPTSDFRHFNVVVRLPEHAFGGPYTFNLYWGAHLVGSVAVFARENESPCGACAFRREKASAVRGVIHLPSHIVDKILGDKIRGHDNAMENAADFITASLSGTLVDGCGRVLASAQGGRGAKAVPKAEAAIQSVQPVEISLFSAAVSQHDNDDDEPTHFFDWKPHTGLFPVSPFKSRFC